MGTPKMVKVTEGTVVILVAAPRPHAGKRAVVVSNISGGRLAVCTLDGRMTPVKSGEVIVTSTKLDLPAKISEKYGEKYWKASSDTFKKQLNDILASTDCGKCVCDVLPFLC